ncbi:RNA-binding protein 20-like isoform X2 [Branchiostoma floridae]|uniref:RNA-binding protein 20-like isoform X2 n=1 Tax=Branchiostoma floridae TaxID=7739 RepID=A0A9J7LL06_BRAFL|nr:RNA-binding protein 20-like isoform X2 [Branchiostoma floridae]
MAHRQGYGQNFAQGQAANQRLWSGAVSPNGQGGIASSLLGAVPGGTSMEQLAVIAKVLGNTMQASQLQNINFQAASSALQMQRNMAQQQGGLAGLASVPNALGAGLLGNGPAGLVGNQSASVLANANFQQQQRQLLLQQQQQQQQTSLLGTPPQQRYQNVQQQARRNNKRNNAQRSRYPSGGDRGRSGSWSRDRRTPESDQRSDEGRREEEDGPEVKRSRVDATAYDPSDPTPDDDDVRNADQVPAGSDIQVTIQQGGEGRTVNDDRPGQQSPEQQKIYICYACNAKCYNLRNYEAHMTGNRHRQRMLKIQEFTQMRVQQATAHMQARMKAEQHLRKIEGQGLGSGAGSGSGSGSGRHSSGKGNQRKPSTKLEKHWCDTCKINFYGPIVEHRRTKDHKKFRDAQERKKTGRDEEWFPDNPEEMVTVDAVGCFDSDDEDMVDNKEAGEEDFKEVFESNGDKLPDTIEDGEEDVSGDIPAEDADVQPKMEEEEFSLADLPTQDVDLRQMTGPPPVVTNLQNQLQATEEMQDEQAQDSVVNTTPASPTPETTPMEEGNMAQGKVGTEGTASQPQEMGNLQTEEIEMNGEKNSLQTEVQPGEETLEKSSEMKVEENKEQVAAHVAEDATSTESKETSQIQVMDEENNAKVQREESEASAQAQGTENTTALQTEETVHAQAESATTTQTEPTTEAQVLEVQNTALIQTKDTLHAQPQSVNNTTNVDAMEETQAEAPEEVVEELLLPPYDPDCAVGQEFVIPITGYFCKLCHKFYKNEASAIVGHCKSQLHYDNVKAELEKSICVEDRTCVKGSSTTSDVEPSASSDEASSFSTKQSRHPQSSTQASAAGMEEDSGLAVESGRGTDHRDDDVTPQMESTSSAAAGEVWPTTASNVQAYNISSLMDSPGFEVMEVQDNSPVDAAMNIRIVDSFSLSFDADKTVDGLGHGDESDAKQLMDTTVRNTEDVDDGSGNAKVPRAGTPSLMSEIEEYLTESCDDKTADAPKVESNHKDTVEDTITEDTKVVNSESDLCKQGPSTPVVPNQDLLMSSPDTPSLDKPSPARRGGRKTARKSTRGGRRK